MATKYLGERFDIHTGGIDHVRIHHTNEVAQSECVLDVHPWVGTWMHNEFLDLGGEKISKSAGHVLVVDSLVERGVDPLAFRYFFLQAHYRQQQAFSWEALDAAATAYRRLVDKAVAARDAGGTADPARVEPYRRRFWAALADDLNAPQALAVVWEAARDDTLAPADRWAVLADADRGPRPRPRRCPWRQPPTRAGPIRGSMPSSRSARPPATPRTSPPQTGSVTSWPRRASSWSTPRPAPPGVAADGPKRDHLTRRYASTAPASEV